MAIEQQLESLQQTVSEVMTLRKKAIAEVEELNAKLRTIYLTLANTAKTMQDELNGVLKNDPTNQS